MQNTKTEEGSVTVARRAGSMEMTLVDDRLVVGTL